MSHGVILRQVGDHRILRRRDSGHDARLGDRLRLETSENVHDGLHRFAERVQLLFDSALQRLFVHRGGTATKQLSDGVECGSIGIGGNGRSGNGSGDLRGGVNASQRFALASQRRRSTAGDKVGAVQTRECDGGNTTG